MSRVIVLDTGPLGLLTNPKKTPEPRAITCWALDMMAARRLNIPADEIIELSDDLRPEAFMQQ